MKLIVVTNPELGWDCVVAVYDASKISEDDVKELHSDECVIHYTGITKVPKKPKKSKTEAENKIKEIEVFKYTPEIECDIDHLELECDSNSLLPTMCGKHLKPKDYHILGAIANKFISDNNIDLKGCEICVVLANYDSVYSYLGLVGPNRRDVLETFENELHEHLVELGIELF